MEESSIGKNKARSWQDHQLRSKESRMPLAPVDQYGDEYPQEAGATAPSTVQMVPVVSYMFVPVVTYQPCTVEVPSATEIPLDSVPCDKLTEAQEVPKEDHWKEVCPSETYFSSALDSRNSVATSENEWWKEEGVEQLGQWTTDFTLASQLYHDSILPEDQRKEEDWEKQCQPLSDFTMASQAYTEAVDPVVQDNEWKQECTPTLAGESSVATNGYYGVAVTDRPTSEEEDWCQGRPLATEFTATVEKVDRTTSSVEFTDEDWEQGEAPLTPTPQMSHGKTFTTGLPSGL
ncbi:uncharacterized protein LOC125947675 [Dermacentor silvarum]|uniref:uncharacterized protein LOC125947675 n=1 Tax=Dermacentor silvarum TaxID=543639 RepID=UPI00210121B8|nr:uncharacterized protein LOC125947675 [Dermacentor silvarum]